VTGVSGSGKSTLVHDILSALGSASRANTGQAALASVGRLTTSPVTNRSTTWCSSIELIGRTPRSNPVTYIKAFDEIRRISPKFRLRERGYGEHVQLQRKGWPVRSARGLVTSSRDGSG
jgi:excinuclease ABC subunit A